MAKGLQIRLVEEESCASPVRDDVVHIRRFRQLSLLQALLAVGVLKDEAASQCLPSPTIATLRGRSSHLASACIACSLRFCLEFGVALGAGLGVSVTVALASGDGRVASRIGAECEKGHSSEEEKGGNPQRIR